MGKILFFPSPPCLEDVSIGRHFVNSKGRLPSVLLKLWAGSPKSDHVGQEQMKTFLRKQHFFLLSWDNVLFLFRKHRNWEWTSCIGSSNLPPLGVDEWLQLVHSILFQFHMETPVAAFTRLSGQLLCVLSQYCMRIAMTLEGKGKRTSNKNICWGERLKGVNSVDKC